MMQPKPLFSDPVKLRATAELLIERMVADQQWLEQRMREQGRDDSFKRATGKSSLDNAIHSTRRIMHDLDVIIQSKAAKQNANQARIIPTQPNQLPTPAIGI